MDDNDVNIFKSLGFGEEKRNDPALVVFKVRFITSKIEQWKLDKM